MDRVAQILKDSAALNALDSRIEETLKRRDKSVEGREQWAAACKDFHEAFDRLFFPGGSANLSKVRDGDPLAIESAIDFLLADPRHFRSGYVKEELWRRAPKWSLSTEALDTIDKAALDYLRKQMRRDFWYMCRAMARIGRASFWQQVTLHLGSADALVVKRASYLFAYSLGVAAGERVHKQVYYDVLRSKYG